MTNHNLSQVLGTPVGYVTTAPQTYTPTTQGFGTLVSPNFTWWRDGKFLRVAGTFTCGTTTAVEARVYFPSGLTSASASTLEIAGFAARGATGAVIYQVFREVGLTYFTFGRSDGSLAGLTKMNGSDIYGSSTVVSFEASCPIAEWSAPVYVASGADNNVTPLNWTSFTPTGSWTTNTTYTGKYRRVGDSMEVQTKVSVTGAPTSTTLSLNIPGNLTIDSSKIVDTSNQHVLGSVVIMKSGVGRTSGLVLYNKDDATSKSVYAFATDTASATSTSLSGVTQAYPHTFANGDNVEVYYTVPIVGWTAQYYLGKMLVGFGQAKVGQSGLVNNDSSNVGGTPILGATDGSAASAGYVGEFFQSGNGSNSGAGTAGQYFDIGSKSLTPGDWRISWAVTYYNNGATSFTEAITGVGTAPGNSSQDINPPFAGIDQYKAAAVTGITFTDSIRVNVSSTQVTVYNGTDRAGTARAGSTVYLKGYVNDNTNGPVVYRWRWTLERIR